MNVSDQGRSQPRDLAPAVVVCGLFLMGLYLSVSVIMAMNGGRFIYALDDPYIHLALAEGIARGHYGINPTESCAPSSSILWPFLLTPFVWLRIDEWAPLALCAVSACGTLCIAVRAAGDVFAASKRRVELQVGFGVAFALATDQIGLAISGMEHNLQVFLSVAILWGLWRRWMGAPAPRWLWLVLVAAPLVRYENLAFSAVALILLALRGNWRAAAVSLLALALLMAGFSAFLMQHGLGWLPSSVIAKSRGISLSMRLQESLAAPTTVPLLLASVMAWRLADRTRRLLAAWVTVGVVAHLIGGRFIPCYPRYELYLWATVLLTLLLFSDRLLARARLLALGGTLAGACWIYAGPIVEAPLSANNIYEQQFQMHRFIRDYWQRPVAVNDIGWVSYRNDQYVLDLYGLANVEALRRTLIESPEIWMDDLAQRHEARLAMIYPYWFGVVPRNWTYLGVLHMAPDRQNIIAGIAVCFYATRPEDAPELRRRLSAFASTLPSGVYFRFADGHLEAAAGDGTTLVVDPKATEAGAANPMGAGRRITGPGQ